MKHKTLLLLFFVFATLVSAHGVRAEDATSSDTRSWVERMEERRETMMENKEERRELFEENATERREAMKTRFDEFKKARIAGLIEIMTNRFEWAIERLENIADRIETRIEKIEEETSANLDTAKASLASAREHIATAQDALGDISVSDLFIDEGTADEKFAGIRNVFATVKEEIRSAWSDLRAALEAIKGARTQDDTETES